MNRGKLALVGIATVAQAAGCSRKNPEFCCLTLEDCAAFDTDEIRQCEGQQVCVDNTCVPTPDGPLVDGRPDASGPDAADPCVAAGGVIAFQTDRDGDFEIARVLPDGTGYGKLTDNGWSDTSPRWSSDGRQIAWTTRPAGETQVWVMNTDGSDAHMASNGEGYDPRWAQGSEMLSFTTSRDDPAHSEIYGVQADASGGTNLSQNGATDFEASWAPDGSRLAFTSDRSDGTPRIYLMSSDGTGQVRLRDRTGRAAQWSSDGITLAFLSVDHLWVATIGGIGETEIYPNVAFSYAWAPDGSTLVVWAATGNLFAVTTTPGTPAPLTTTGLESEPQWSPDGSRIVFTSRRDGNREIYVMNSDGSSPVNISQDPGEDRNPVWAPCPQ
jgi:Tol biopolymer transport system component